MERKLDIISLIACSLTVVILATLFFALPKREISTFENRALKDKPTLNTQNLLSGEYTADLGEYISDHFPAREVFVGAKAYSEMLLLKRENNGVILAKEQTLIPKTQLGDRINYNLDTIKAFSTAVDVPVFLAVLPSTSDVFAELLPTGYSTEQNDRVWQQYYSKAEQLKLNAPNLYNPLCEGNNYYRTDHHYNSLGAYQTYELLSGVIGYTPKSKEFFDVQTVSQNFCGTSMRTSGFYLNSKDSITLFRYDGDENYTITADGKVISLYDFSKLETTDQYAVFLGGNHAKVDITSGEGKPQMLIIRDSFADSIAPFLAIHYDLTLIDLRYYNESVQELVKTEKYDCVLLLQNITEFSSSKNISYLRME